MSSSSSSSTMAARHCIIIVMFAFIFYFNEVRGHCLERHKSLLLNFKHSLVIHESYIHEKSPNKLANWNSSTDCCLWPGVTCSGMYVTGLDLSNEGIVGGSFTDSSPLFDLTSLTSLNLARKFQYTLGIRRGILGIRRGIPDIGRLPSGIGRLVNLMNLNISRSGSSGQIPIEISNLTRNTVSVIVKGHQRNWTKISTIYTLVDFSDNKFEGDVPHELGELKFLYVLNLSHNLLSGRIPPSFGNLYNIESLDLSKNELSGKIPEQLASLNFLSTLDLSFNHLDGMIPKGRQFQTFTEASFKENKGLCGQPLDTICGNVGISSPPNPSFESKDHRFRNIFIATGIGYALGLGLVIIPLIFWSRLREEYYECIDKVLINIFYCQPKKSQIVSQKIRRGN